MKKLHLYGVLLLFIVGEFGGAQTVSPLEVRENPHSVLSALISLEVLGASEGAEVTVRYETEGEPAGETPAYPVEEGTQEIAVLGLLPETTYDITAHVSGADTEARSITESFTTGSLPEPLQDLTIETAGESPKGYSLVETFLGSSERPSRQRDSSYSSKVLSCGFLERLTSSSTSSHVCSSVVK